MTSSSMHRFLTALAAAALALASGTAQNHCERKLTAGNGHWDDEFGQSIAVSGETAVIGAPGHWTNAVKGSAYVFARRGTAWTQEAELVPTDPAVPPRLFGEAVAIDGTTIAVGDRGASGMASFSGAVYVFVRSGATWVQQQKVIAPDGATNDEFGSSVALHDGLLLVGAPGDDSNAGSAYLFRWPPSSQNPVVKLQANDRAAGHRFGRAMAIHGERALIGAPRHNRKGRVTGAAYIFEQGKSLWYQTASLVPTDGADDDYFGQSVALHGDTAVIGSPYDDDLGETSGSAYVFERGLLGWSQSKLWAGDGAKGHQFGTSVAVSSRAILVGAWIADGVSIASGAAYLFRPAGPSAPRWTQQLKLTASDGAIVDYFGQSAALSGETAVIGAPGEDDRGLGAGAAYAFSFEAGSITPFGTGCQGSNGLPQLLSTDAPHIGTSATYRVRNLRPSSAAILVFGASKSSWNGIPLPLSLGFLGAQPTCTQLVANALSFQALAGPGGDARWVVPFPASLPIGAEIYSQVLAIDLGVTSPLKLTVSNALHTIAGCQ